MQPTRMAPCFVSLLSAASGLRTSILSPEASFDEYISHFGRDYLRDSSEYRERLALFEVRAQAVRTQNADSDAAWAAALNKFSDRTEAELKAFRGWRPTRRASSGGTDFLQQEHGASGNVTLPESKDWSHLESVKLASDQGSCGSCWAVAAATMLSAHYEIKSGTVKRFSPQQLVDCTPNPQECGGTGGCSGATVELAMQYAQSVGLAGLPDMDALPYSARDEKCTKSIRLLDSGLRGGRQQDLVGSGVQLSGFATLKSNQLRPLLEALLDGPVAVSAAASNWYQYSSGIFTSCDSDWVVNHAVLCMGYGKERGTNYLNIRNSWGQDWGENGNLRVAHLPIELDQQCGEDNEPEAGVECKPYPDRVTVCGTCGLLYDSVRPLLIMG